MKKETNLNHDIYELLRVFHGEIHDLQDDLELTDEQKLAIDTLDGLLYLVEGHFTDF
jgi:hypothetical protein